MGLMDKRLKPTSGFLAVILIGGQVVTVSVKGVCDWGAGAWGGGRFQFIKKLAVAKTFERAVVLPNIYKTEEMLDDRCVAPVFTGRRSVFKRRNKHLRYKKCPIT